MRRMALVLALSGIVAGCSYKESFPYKGDSLVNFKTDSLYFSFGELPFSVTDTTLLIGVEIIGSTAYYDRMFNIALDNSRTTARLREHYDEPRMEGTIPSGASAGTVALTIHRLSLQSDSVFTVVLDMLPGEDFRLGAVEDRSVPSVSRTGLTCRNGGRCCRSGLASTIRANTRSSSSYGEARLPEKISMK